MVSLVTDIGSLAGMNKQGNGFTLIEILVVMVIILIVTTIAVLSIGDAGRAREVRYNAENIITRLQYAEEYAILTPALLQFSADEHGYTFSVLSSQKQSDGAITSSWVPPKPHILAAQHMPSYMTLSLNHPVIINTNGSLTPFVLKVQVVGEKNYDEITGNAAGQLTLTGKP